MIKENKIINFLPYVGLVMVIVLPWFLKSGYLFFTDMSWGPNVTVPDFASSGYFYLMVLVKLLNFVLPSDLLQKLFITVVFGVILFGGYKIAESFIPLEKNSQTGQAQNKLILFLGSAFALFNPFVYDRVMYGQFGLVLSYGFFLAAFGYLISYYFEPFNKKQLFLSSVFAGLSILFAPHFIFFIGLVYFIFGILILTRSSKRNLLRLAKYLVLSFLIIITINFNWLYGAFFEKGQLKEFVETKITKQDLQAFRTRGDTPFKVAENVLLMSGFWGIEQFRYESLENIKENWGRSFYFLLPIILLGLIYNFKNKEKRKLSIGFILIYSVAFVLALGIALPITSKITLWLFNNVLFYKGLREPQKWVAVMVAIYEILLVCGLIELFKKRIIIKHKELATVLLAGIIIFQAPLLIGGGAGQVGPVDYPWDWYEVNEFIKLESYKVESKKCEGKILFLPWHLYMRFKWIGNIVANPSSKFFECPVIYGKNMEFSGIFGRSLDKDERKVEDWVFNFGRTDLLQENKLNISYIILAKEVDWKNYLWLGNHPNVELVKETENFKVYKVKKYYGE